jgi:hypothetical protein
MGFADVSTDIRQMAGNARPLRIEAGCFSGTSATTAVATQLTHCVGGMAFSCVTSAICVGRPLIGSACDGFIDFTFSTAPVSANGQIPYLVAGW